MSRMAKEIPLTRGYVAIVDDEDYENLAQHKWYALVLPGGLIYAVRMPGTKATRKMILMHRVVMNAEHGSRVDHRDGDGRNNRRLNLRFSTQSQNIANARKETGKGLTSQHKGVYFNKYHGKWHAQVIKDGRRIYLGRYHSETEAALAYNFGAVHHFGEFARLNEVHV